MNARSTSNTDDRLMQYFDGELSSEEMDVVRAELEGDEELRAKLDGLEHLRELMRTGVEEVGADLDADALFAAVEAKLAEEGEADDDPMFPEPVAEEPATGREGAEEAEARPALEVLDGGKAGRESVPAEVVREEAPSRTGLWIGVAGGLAAAAAVLFFLLRTPSGVDDTGGGGEGTDPTPVVAAPPGSEVEDVDFGYSTGSIFTVEDPEEDTRYAVVWISDEKIELDEPQAPDAPEDDRDEENEESVQ